jgi:hypothetical protein
MPQLKNNFQGRPGERIPHNWLNVIANFYNDFSVSGAVLTRRSDGRFTNIAVPRSPLDDFLADFLISDIQGTVVTLEPGIFAHANVPLTIVNLPSTIQCPTPGTIETFIQYDIENNSATFAQSSSQPASSGTWEYYPLHRITSDGVNVGTVHHYHPASFNTDDFITLAGDPRPQEPNNVAGFVSAITDAVTSPPGTAYITLTHLLGTITVDAGAGDIEVGTAGTTLYLGVEWGTEAGTYPDGYWNHDKLGWGTTNFFADNFGAICFDHDPRYWIKGQTYEQNYGTSIGSDSVTPVIILENRILCNGTSAGTWYAGYPGDPKIDFHCNHDINAQGVYKVQGVQVVGTQETYSPSYGPPFGATGIADGEAGTPYAAVSELQTAFNDIRDLDSRINNIVAILINHGLAVVPA